MNIKNKYNEMKRILITSALPYINGIKHLGNLVGSQLPAEWTESGKRKTKYLGKNLTDA